LVKNVGIKAKAKQFWVSSDLNGKVTQAVFQAKVNLNAMMFN